MAFRFSENLIQEIIRCFKEEDEIVLTPEQADEYLASFAGLFLAFAEKDGDGSREAATSSVLT